MITTNDRDNMIAVRCAALGLSRSQAQALADAGPFQCDLVQVLGLDSETLMPRPPKPWLSMAAQTASCSYKGALTSENLLGVLVQGEVPAEFAAHIICFLEEVQMGAFVQAIEQAAKQSGMPISEIWRNVAQINKMLQGRRLPASDGERIGF